MRILITGANSYIGGAVETRLVRAGHEVTVVDMVGEGWRTVDFEGFDSVFHVAGIAHDTRSKRDSELYYAVNRDLAVQTAQKARDSGVGQFVFMSSMLVYNGVGAKNITLNTIPKVKGCYGDSKLQADLALQELGRNGFNVAILRPPMIFGKGCKGNFPRLVKLALKTPLFPKISNRRSMLHIDNLCEFVRLVIENRDRGIFFPKNPEYFCTTDIAICAAALKGKRLKTTPLFNWLIYLMFPLLPPLRKLFGNLTYDHSMSKYLDNSYQLVDNQESINSALLEE